MKYTREYLIDLCEKAIVPVEKWGNRDTPSSQSDIGTIWAYLKAGCKFRIRRVQTTCSTNTSTIWIEIFHYKFEEEKRWHLYYMPTEKRLKKANGEDWY